MPLDPEVMEELSIDALRAQLAEREAELVRYDNDLVELDRELLELRSSERERLISELVAQSCFPYNRDVAANALIAHERARRAKEKL